jgi:hypothetical protein
MKTLPLLFSVLCWGQFDLGLILAEPSSQVSGQTTSEYRSSGTDDRSSKEVHLSQSSSQEQRTAEQHPETNPGDVRPGDLERPTPAAGSRQEHLKPQGNHLHVAGKPNLASPAATLGNITSTRRPAVSQSQHARKEVPMKGAVEYRQNRSFAADPGHRLVTLPVGPARNGGPAPTVIGGPLLSPVTRNSAVLNGTGLKHKP